MIFSMTCKIDLSVALKSHSWQAQWNEIKFCNSKQGCTLLIINERWYMYIPVYLPKYQNIIFITISFSTCKRYLQFFVITWLFWEFMRGSVYIYYSRLYALYDRKGIFPITSLYCDLIYSLVFVYIWLSLNISLLNQYDIKYICLIHCISLYTME